MAAEEDTGDDSERRRGDRRDIGAWGKYRTGRGIARDVKILDVNEKGCRFFDKFGTLKPDDRLVLRIGNVGPLLTYVRWNKDSEIGAEFEEPLYGAVLEHISKYFDERSAEEKALEDKGE
ncbi:hypothetical protein [Altererythrobacter sp. MF3-039]|uniref:hypothetical protein n=1 Tax=Altererythrobacter sp. MF3-039 TaxID=3252901 RepID=UPI00390C7EA1